MNRSSQWIGCHDDRQKRPVARDRRLDKARICATRLTGRQSEINAYGVENIFRRSIGLPTLDVQDILAHPPYSDNPLIDQPIFGNLGP